MDVEPWLEPIVAARHWAPLFLLIAVMLYGLGKRADVLIASPQQKTGGWYIVMTSANRTRL